MGAPKTGGRIVGHCVGARGVKCGRPLGSRKYALQLGVHENHGGMRCPSCARYHRQPESGVGRRTLTEFTDGRTRLYPPPGEWVLSASCAGVDLDLHFPEKGGTNAPAKLVCRGCPVAEECLKYALDNHIEHGVWSGTSPADREAMRSAREAA